MGEFFLASPIIAIGIFCVVAMVLDAASNNNHKLGFWFAILSLIVTGMLACLTICVSPETLSQLNPLNTISKGMISFGRYSAYLDLLFCLAGIMTLLSARPYFQRANWETNEFYNLILFAISGMVIIAHANHLLALFVGIEIMSITFYILAGYFRSTIKSIEASLKYFLLGSFATGFLLYGMAMIYGATGSMDLTLISAKIINGNINNHTYLTIGFAMMLVGLSFKAAAFPFHQWAPDVYTGSPTVVTAFMSTAGKAAALIAFIIIARSLMPFGIHDAQTILMTQKAQLVIAVISALTMLIGNITALVQKNIKRMLAYSSVAHAGYLLMGVVANNQMGWKGIIFYSSAYMLMQIGAFVVLSVLERETDKNLELNDYAGLSKKHPALAAMMTIFMLSLAGIPPMAGFFGKYMIFTSAIQAGYIWLVLVAVVSSIISVYFYNGLIVYMYFKDSAIELEGEAGSANIALYLATFGVLFLGIFPFLLDNLLTKII